VKVEFFDPKIRNNASVYVCVCVCVCVCVYVCIGQLHRSNKGDSIVTLLVVYGLRRIEVALMLMGW
jgi:hypothetical protein